MKQNLNAYRGALVLSSYDPDDGIGIIADCKRGPYGNVASVVRNGKRRCESLHLLTVVGWVKN
jgi:hypothetical protein